METAASIMGHDKGEVTPFVYPSVGDGGSIARFGHAVRASVLGDGTSSFVTDIR